MNELAAIFNRPTLVDENPVGSANALFSILAGRTTASETFINLVNNSHYRLNTHAELTEIAQDLNAMAPYIGKIGEIAHTIKGASGDYIKSIKMLNNFISNIERLNSGPYPGTLDDLVRALHGIVNILLILILQDELPQFDWANGIDNMTDGQIDKRIRALLDGDMESALLINVLFNQGLGMQLPFRLKLAGIDSGLLLEGHELRLHDRVREILQKNFQLDSDSPAALVEPRLKFVE